MARPRGEPCRSADRYRPTDTLTPWVSCLLCCDTGLPGSPVPGSPFLGRPPAWVWPVRHAGLPGLTEWPDALGFWKFTIGRRIEWSPKSNRSLLPSMAPLFEDAAATGSYAIASLLPAREKGKLRPVNLASIPQHCPFRSPWRRTWPVPYRRRRLSPASRASRALLPFIRLCSCNPSLAVAAIA